MFPEVPFFLPWLQKPFTRCPFFNLDNLGKNQITLETFFLRVARTIIPTKYYFKLNLNCTCSQLSFEVHYTIETQNF